MYTIQHAHSPHRYATTCTLTLTLTAAWCCRPCNCLHTRRIMQHANTWTPLAASCTTPRLHIYAHSPHHACKLAAYPHHDTSSYNYMHTYHSPHHISRRVGYALLAATICTLAAACDTISHALYMHSSIMFGPRPIEYPGSDGVHGSSHSIQVTNHKGRRTEGPPPRGSPTARVFINKEQSQISKFRVSVLNHA